MSTLADPHIFTEERGNTIIENKPEWEQWCCVGNKIRDDFHFLAYTFYSQISCNISLMKKK